jgi:hypothetical protein
VLCEHSTAQGTHTTPCTCTSPFIYYRRIGLITRADVQSKPTKGAATHTCISKINTTSIGPWKRITTLYLHINTGACLRIWHTQCPTSHKHTHTHTRQALPISPRCPAQHQWGQHCCNQLYITQAHNPLPALKCVPPQSAFEELLPQPCPLHARACSNTTRHVSQHLV